MLVGLGVAPGRFFPVGFAALAAMCRLVGTGATTGSDLIGPDSFTRVTPLVIDSTDNRAHPAPERNVTSHAILVIVLMLAGMVV